MALMKLCRCGKRIEYRTRCCDSCTIEMDNEKSKKVKRYDREVRYSEGNKRYTTFYNSQAWRTLSEVIKGRFSGLCLICLIEREEVVQSDTTHHIVELKEDWNLRLVEENLIALCHSCHNNLHVNYSKKDKIYLKDIIKKFKNKYKL